MWHHRFVELTSVDSTTPSTVDLVLVSVEHLALTPT
jgi:hypothetical protein